MKPINFDEIIDRREVSPLKYNEGMMQRIFGRSDLFPSWVADMEFKSPPPVIEALVKRAQHGNFGYQYRTESLIESIVGWNQKRHNWSFKGDELVFCPSVLSAIASIVTLFTEPGDGIIIQPPVFFDFKLIIGNHQRRLIKNPLILADGLYQMDFEDLEAKAADPANRLLILCNPHNPVGRVWTKAELQRLGEICARHNVLVISDEIHADIVFSSHHHTPFASVSQAHADLAFTCLSPAKSFNIASCSSAFMVIANTERRKKVADFTNHYEINKTNAFAHVAMETAYREGAEWLDLVLDYLHKNIEFVRDYLDEHVPGVEIIEPQGTFLLWLDFRKLGFEAPELQEFLVQKAGLALNMGHWFGREGAGFARLNIACPKSQLQKALDQLAAEV